MNDPANQGGGDDYYDDPLYEGDEDFNKKYVLPEVPDHQRPDCRALSHILDLNVQQTYADLQKLVDGLLKEPNEHSRRMPLLVFLHATTSRFWKTYALVRWVKTFHKLDQHHRINHFLDDITTIFEESAEGFFGMVSEETPFIGLPRFRVECALEVLTLHTYITLPRVLRTKFQKSQPLTGDKLQLTLKHLNHKIKNDIIALSRFIPPYVDKVMIRDGTLILTATDLFEARLIKKSDHAQPWRLLNVRVLVSDYGVGTGCDLVHPQHEFDGLGTFCQLKMDKWKAHLDVVRCRVKYTALSLSPDFVDVESYKPREQRLTIKFWPRLKHQQTYRITLRRDENRPGLLVSHEPPGFNLPTLEVQNGNPLVHKLLLETAFFRCGERLRRIRRLLAHLPDPATHLSLVGDAGFLLVYRLLPYQNTRDDEHLKLSVRLLTGRAHAQVGALLHADAALLRRLERTLEELLEDALQHHANTFYHTQPLQQVLAEVRMQLVKRRYVEALQGQHANQAHSSFRIQHLQHVPGISPHNLIFWFPQDPAFYLVVSFNVDVRKNITARFFLVSSSDGERSAVETSPAEMLNHGCVPDLDFVGRKGFKKPAKYPLTIRNTTSWTVIRAQLRALVSTVENQIQFNALQRAVHQHGLSTRLDTERTVGGKILRITNTKDLLRFDTAGFEEHLVECGLRVHRHGLFHLEISMKNPPVWKSDQPPHKYFTFMVPIHHGAYPNFTTLYENLKRSLADQLTNYAKLFKRVKEFSVAYECGLKEQCSVMLYNYYKLMVRYGAARDQVLLVSSKASTYQHLIPNFQQSFHSEGTQVRHNRRWNAHVLVSELLTEHLKERQDDLVGLVNYCVNTDRSLAALYHFALHQLHSRRGLDQLTGADEAKPPNLGIRNVITPLSETCLHLTYGFAHVEFRLLAENRVALRAWRQNNPNDYLLDQEPQLTPLPGFSRFWMQASGAKSLETLMSAEAKHDSGKNSTNPASVPSQENDPFSDTHPYPMSCPPTYDERFEEFVKYVDEQEKNDLNKLFVVEADVFEQALANNKQPRQREVMVPVSPSLFENYLRGVNYIARLPKILQTFAGLNPINPNYIPVKEIQHDDWSVSFEMVGVPPPASSYPPWKIRARVFLCPRRFQVGIRLDIVGPNPPGAPDLDVYQRYFEACVVPTGNEFALLSFLAMCRASSQGVFAAFARLMSVQLEPHALDLNFRWLACIQLVGTAEAPAARPLSHNPNDPTTTPTTPAAATSALHFSSGVFLDQNKDELRITIGLKQAQPPRAAKPKQTRMTFLYHMYRDTMTLHSLQTRFHAKEPADELTARYRVAVERLLQDQASKKIHDVCTIWPSIRHILELYREEGAR